VTLEVDRAQVFGETVDAAERIAPGYFPKHVEAEHIARYRWAASRARGRSVLDVACGTGYGSALIAAAGRLVYAIDVNAAALRFARGRYPGPRYLRADAHALPLRSATVDTVVSLETIEHLSDARSFLLALRAVMRKGGVLLLSSPNAEETAHPNPHHVHEMSLEELSALLRVAGFRVTGVWGQFWRLRGRPRFWKLKGFGRLAFYVSRACVVSSLPGRFGFRPAYWCIRALAADIPSVASA
jgi:SAM-dependent methyltransferase